MKQLELKSSSVSPLLTLPLVTFTSVTLKTTATVRVSPPCSRGTIPSRSYQPSVAFRATRFRSGIPLAPQCSALHEHVSPNADCWDSGKTLRLLAEGDYFKVNDELDWSQGIRPLLDDGSTLGLTAKEDCELAVRALCALVWYLKQCQLDQGLLSRRCFQIYEPIDQDKPEETEKNPFGSHMVLDGMTLRNLDVLINSSLGTVHGSLLERLNRCSTAFGQRMMRHWLCAPLVKPEAINDRLDAVEHLRNDITIVDDISKILKTLPDLERLVNSQK